MHKRRVNELTLGFVVEPAGPLLIKSGGESGADPTLSAMNFVRTQHGRLGETIYLPGSSLKGVVRSHSERILRTVFGGAERAACDPLARRNSCSERLKSIPDTDTAQQYKELCLACRIFGHQYQASHIFISDAYPTRPVDTLPVRYNVAIDRLSGGVAVGPFDMEVAMESRFFTTISLVNFELWQVGLLALSLRDLAEGRVRIGFAKSRGLGEVRAYFTQLSIAYPGRLVAEDEQQLSQQILGVGALASDLTTAYGYVEDDRADYPQPAHLAPQSDIWGRPELQFGVGDAGIAHLEGDALQNAHREVTAILAATIPAWGAYVQQYRREWA